MTTRADLIDNQPLEIHVAIGRVVAGMRYALELEQSTLAAKIGVSRTILGRLERMGAYTWPTIHAVCHVLGVTYPELLELGRKFLEAQETAAELEARRGGDSAKLHLGMVEPDDDDPEDAVTEAGPPHPDAIKNNGDPVECGYCEEVIHPGEYMLERENSLALSADEQTFFIHPGCAG